MKYRDLYYVIEDVIAAAIPLWSESLSCLSSVPKRVIWDKVEYDIPEELISKQRTDESDIDFEDRSMQELECEEHMVLPEPDPRYSHLERFRSTHLVDKFSQKGLQVIVKLANIHLTPHRPSYAGRSWHVEGQLVSHVS